MKPAEYDIEIYEGDTYFGPVITLPDLTPFGGPSNLSTATINAQIRKSEKTVETLATFTVAVLDSMVRTIRCTLTPAQTVTLSDGVWDLQVTEDDWVGTIIKGKVKFIRGVTR